MTVQQGNLPPAPQSVPGPPQSMPAGPPQSVPPPLPPPPLPPPLPPVRRRLMGRLTVGLSLLGVGFAAAALIVTLARPAPVPPPAAHPAAPVYTPEQVAAAKTKACAAWKLSSDGLIANTNRANPTGPDDALGWANFANGRYAYLSAALWLPKQVDPATPQDLKDTINLFASTAGDSAARSMTEDKSSENVDAFNKNLDTLNANSKKIDQLCR